VILVIGSPTDDTNGAHAVSKIVIDATDNVAARPRREDRAAAPMAASPDRLGRLISDPVLMRQLAQQRVVVDHLLRMEKDQRLPGLFGEPADADFNGPIWIDIHRDEERGVGMKAAHVILSIVPWVVDNKRLSTASTTRGEVRARIGTLTP